jgi:2-polyprenyl-6-methoxyphenol hydroxylase-like FAD-dependent oxidoreductase
MGQGGCLAIEDGVVLADSLRSSETIDDALQTFVERRRPRIQWVQDQSDAALRFWLQPPTMRDAALRERGDQAMRARYAPLLAAP